MDQLKHCPECGQDKPRSAFKRHRKSADGLQKRCMGCSRTRRDAVYARFYAERTAKVCPRCGEARPLSEYWKDAKRKDGLQTYCKPCFTRGTAGERARAREKSIRAVAEGLITTKRCPGCRQTKPIADFGPDATHYYGVASRCKQCKAQAEASRRAGSRAAGHPLWAAYSTALKVEVLGHYAGGREPRCACCGTAYLPHLTLDHTKGDGGHERKRLGITGGGAFYRQLRKAGYPEGYRVLCYNCNVASFRVAGGCQCRSPQPLV